MTNDVFRALQRWFKADAECVRLGRVLYLGFRGEAVKSKAPYCEVTIIKREDRSTFQWTIHVLECVFSLYSRKTDRPEDGNPEVGLLLDRIIERFHKLPSGGVGLPSVAFSTVGMRNVAAEWPSIRNGIWFASATFELIVQRSIEDSFIAAA